jgi:hypothetical protein
VLQQQPDAADDKVVVLNLSLCFQNTYDNSVRDNLAPETTSTRRQNCVIAFVIRAIA